MLVVKCKWATGEEVLIDHVPRPFHSLPAQPLRQTEGCSGGCQWPIKKRWDSERYEMFCMTCLIYDIFDITCGLYPDFDYGFSVGVSPIKTLIFFSPDYCLICFLIYPKNYSLWSGAVLFYCGFLPVNFPIIVMVNGISLSLERSYYWRRLLYVLTVCIQCHNGDVIMTTI